MAVFSGISILQNANFFHRFIVARLKALTCDAGIVVVLTFDEEVISARAATAYVEANAIAEATSLSGGGNTGEGKGEFVGVKAGDGEAADFKGADGAADLTVVDVKERII